MVTHLTDADFDGFIADGVAIVDFWASWCGPCRMFGPIFEQVSDQIDGVKFGKFEVTEANRLTPGKFGIRSIPAILAFKNGELIEARTGLMEGADFADWVKTIKG